MRIERERLRLGTPFAPPRSEEERRLAGIWAEALNLDRVGVHDAFEELGGDSLSAEVIVLGAAGALGCALQPGDLIAHPTVARMAELARKAPSAGRLPAHVTMQRAGAGGPPVCFLHGGLGYFLPRRAFIDAIAPERPIFMIQTIGMSGEAETPRTIPALAAAYLSGIRDATGARPFHLAAVCAGGDIALEMACQMEEAGDAPLSMTLFDSGAPYRMRRHRSPQWFADLRRWAQTETQRLRRKLTGGRGPEGPAPGAAAGAGKAAGLTDAAAAAIRIVDAARRRHRPRRWSGTAHMIASAPGVETRAAAWRELVGTLDVRVVSESHRELLRGQAALSGAVFESILARAEGAVLPSGLAKAAT